VERLRVLGIEPDGGVEIGPVDSPEAADEAVAVLGEVEAEADVDVAEAEIAELDDEVPGLGVVPEAGTKVEKLPAKKPAARRRPAPAKKPAPGVGPETEAEED